RRGAFRCVHRSKIRARHRSPRVTRPTQNRHSCNRSAHKRWIVVHPNESTTRSHLPEHVHPVLSQQIATIFGTTERVPDTVQVLAALIDEAYRQADTDRAELTALIEGASRQLLEDGLEFDAAGNEFRELFNLNPIPMLVCSEVGHTVLAVNESAAGIVGGIPATLVGRQLDSLAPGIEELLTASPQSGNGGRQLGEQYWRRDRGPELVLNLIAHPV